ncbi:MAG: hypothetical protein GC137_09225 [Alphaproteobacteria bacterium]|nr:hypothetical protein [Alphaproteobacteria bacterium]
MKSCVYSMTVVFSMLLLAGCASDQQAFNETAMKKVGNIEEEPITRMSFVPNEDNPASDMQIILYKDHQEDKDLLTE